jgi:hypothetical protein
MEIESLYVVVGDFKGAELIPNKENVLSHERVVESCMESATPLPFRFGAVVGEDKLKAFVQRNTAALKSDLEKVQNCVEMGLKVLFPAAAEEAPLTGTAFLNAKRQRQQLQTTAVGWADGAVSGLVRQTSASLMLGTRASIVRIAHLVLRCHLDDYKSHIDTLVRERTDVQFLRSGPWPPYSFTSTSSLG